MKALKLTLIMTLAFSLEMMAQPAPPTSNNPAPIPGLALLAAAGAAFGAKKVYDKKKEAE